MGAKVRVGDNIKKIDNYFKEWREWRGWTQQELADALGTTRQTVNRHENSYTEWNKAYLESFAHVMGCNSPTDPIMFPPEKNDDDADITSGIPYRQVRPQLVDLLHEVIENTDRINFDPEMLTSSIVAMLDHRLSEPPMSNPESNTNVVRFQLRQLEKD